MGNLSWEGDPGQRVRQLGCPDSAPKGFKSEPNSALFITQNSTLVFNRKTQEHTPKGGRMAVRSNVKTRSIYLFRRLHAPPINHWLRFNSISGTILFACNGTRRPGDTRWNHLGRAHGIIKGKEILRTLHSAIPLVKETQHIFTPPYNTQISPKFSHETDFTKHATWHTTYTP